jgi:hypothetical protein
MVMAELTGEDVVQILAVVFLFGGPLIGFVVYAVASNWRQVRIAEQEAVLKKEMLDRGFTPEQILAVLSAGSEPAETANPDLLGTMVEGGYTGDDIARVTAAIDGLPAAGRAEAIRLAHKMAEHGYDGDDLVRFLESRTEADASPAGGP